MSSTNANRSSADWTRPSSFFFPVGKGSDVGGGEGRTDGGEVNEAELTSLPARATLIPFSEPAKSTDDKIVIENILHAGRGGDIGSDVDGVRSGGRVSGKSAAETIPLDDEV
ncbi:hypothetical protein EON63_05840 [archaeon]|nr:MAG: hypothetical protein EON63_05840 [archaeon]